MTEEEWLKHLNKIVAIEKKESKTVEELFGRLWSRHGIRVSDPDVFVKIYCKKKKYERNMLTP